MIKLSFALLAAVATPALAAGPVLTPAQHAATRVMFEHVINTPTVIGRHQTPAMAQFVADQFLAAGFAKEDVHVVPYHTGSATTGEDDTAARNWSATYCAIAGVWWRPITVGVLMTCSNMARVASC